MNNVTENVKQYRKSYGQRKRRSSLKRLILTSSTLTGWRRKNQQRKQQHCY